MMKELTVEHPYAVTIYVAGDLDEIRRTCRRQTFAVGLCVTVTATEFIYTGGAESGAAIGLVNYPRFPKDPETVFAQACDLAEALMTELYQWSVLVQAVDRSVWMTRRGDDNANPGGKA